MAETIFPLEHIGLVDNSSKSNTSCAECGNCCRNFFTTTNAQTVLYFQERGTFIGRCRNEDYFNDVVSFAGSYKEGLYYWVDTDAPLEEMDPNFPVEIAVVGDCVNLQNNICIDYENRPERPCKNFAQGSNECNNNRLQIGLHSIVSIDSIKTL